jgi:hypothetical protein
MHAFAHFAFALLLCAWGFICGIGVSSSVYRWLRATLRPWLQARKEARQRVAQRFGGLH